jgi:hypothetical protein
MPNQELERRLRRSYSALLFGGPWLLVGAGFGLVIFALLAEPAAPTQFGVLAAGVVMAVIGLLSPRISGPLELSAKGLKGSLDAVPADALYVARAAAVHAANDTSNSDAEVIAGNAAFQAMEDFSAANLVARILTSDRTERDVVLLILTRDSDLRSRFLEIIIEALLEQIDRATKRGEALSGTRVDEATVKRLQGMLDDRESQDKTQREPDNLKGERNQVGPRRRRSLDEPERGDRERGEL